MKTLSPNDTSGESFQVSLAPPVLPLVLPWRSQLQCCLVCFTGEWLIQRGPLCSSRRDESKHEQQRSKSTGGKWNKKQASKQAQLCDGQKLGPGQDTLTWAPNPAALTLTPTGASLAC
jgi:hypothetical protein